MSKGEDTFGCAIAALVMIGGAGWLWNTYEIRKRPPPAPPPPFQAPRPTGSITITSTKEGSVYYLDTDTVTGSRKARRAWISINHQKDKTMSARLSKELSLVNCETGGVQILSRVSYGAGDKVLFSEDFETKDAKTVYYPPGSVGSALPNEICRSAYDSQP